jgi:hypothetical protein
MPDTFSYDCCSECGGSLENGYSFREYPRDSETGAADDWIVCAACLEKEKQADSSDDDGRYEAGDMAYNLEVGA